MEEYNYDALASTINIEDITSNGQNQEILRRLKDNDIQKNLWISNVDDGDEDDVYYIPDIGGWLGYFIGSNTSLQELHINRSDTIQNLSFCKGLRCNKSIKKIHLCDVDLPGGETLQMLGQFFKNNRNLTEIGMLNCELGAEGARWLSLALGDCAASLQRFALVSNHGIGDGQMADIILALSMHPQLEVLRLPGMGIGRDECTALATLLRNTTKQLQTLHLFTNNIDDEGVEVLVHALSSCNLLQELHLSYNRDITIKGWKTVSTLFEAGDSNNLEELFLLFNNFGDAGALIFANALRGNTKLKTLALFGNEISRDGWAPFSKLLCDTSSVNKTYLSNHTLIDFGPCDLPADLASSRQLNRVNVDKGQVAMTKILQHHSCFNMQPFFEWEFKVLPLIINWFANAHACTTEFDEQIRKMKLSCLYDFVREFPMLYVEPVTRKEIQECSAMEEQLMGGETQNDKLEEVQQRKTRAMRRLF